MAPAASPEAIAKAYKKLAIAFHPDKRGAALSPDEEHYFKAVTTANEVLSDADKRKQYDSELHSHGAQENLFSHMQ